MGTDIHMAVEVRRVSGYQRPDAYVQGLRQRRAQGDPEAAVALEAISVREGPWELVAISSYRGWDMGPEGEVMNLTPEVPAGGGWVGVVTEDEDDVAHKAWLGSLPAWWEGRSYSAFARMAGVRGEPGISEPRGYPEDYDKPEDTSEWDFSQLGDHSWSWLLASEVLGYEGWSEGRWPVVDFTRAWADRFGAGAVRLVFGFDS